MARPAAASRVLPAAVLCTAAFAPFERALPGSIFGLTMTTSELAVLIALLVAASAYLRSPSRFEWRSPLTVPLLATLAAAALAAVSAPELSGEAMRVTGRFVVAVALFVVVMNVTSTDHTAMTLIAVMLGAGSVVGAVAVLELTQRPWVLEALTMFRPGFHVVGGQLRATSTLVYPTVTSMFLEVAFALGLSWIGARWIAVGALGLVAAGIVATFTRAGLITMAISLAVYGGALYARRGWNREHVRVALLAGIVVALVLLSRSPQLLAARMTAEGSQEWYGASYEVPPELSLTTDSFNDIPVTLTNQGRLTWRSDAEPAFALSYHWLTADSEELISYDGLRTPFAAPVQPGEEASFSARVRAPNYPGRYLLVWDVVQEHRTWLSLEGVFPGRTLVTVDGTASGPPPVTAGRMPGGAMRMPRSVLWEAAIDVWRERPLLGVGPDNFRHVYGRHLGLSTWDARVHANNTYLEVLAGMGVAGAAAMLWLVAAAVRSIRPLIHDTAMERLPVVAAATAACVAIAAHGLVDSFLTFTATYVAFAIAAGVLFAKRGAACA